MQILVMDFSRIQTFVILNAMAFKFDNAPLYRFVCLLVQKINISAGRMFDDISVT